MSLLIAAVLATAPAPVPACSWNHPGHRAFMGDVVAAVDRYQDIPAPVRARLKQRMAQRQYDEIVTIGRDSITGRARYRAQIRDMHFGDGQVCRSVDRSGWKPDAQERGLVYCEDGHCILVPTVCRNVSRIQREGPAVAGAGGLATESTGGAAQAGGVPGGAAGNRAGGDAGQAQAQSAADGGGEAGATPLPAVAGVRAESDLGQPGPLSGSEESAGNTGGALAGPSFSDLSQDRPGRVGDTGTSGGSSGNLGGRGNDTTPLGNLSGSPTGGGGLGGGGIPDIGPVPSPVPPPVPEPGTALLMLGGLAGLWRWRSR